MGITSRFLSDDAPLFDAIIPMAPLGVTVNGIDDLHRALTVLRGTRLLTLNVRPAEMA